MNIEKDKLYFKLLYKKKTTYGPTTKLLYFAKWLV